MGRERISKWKEFGGAKSFIVERALEWKGLRVGVSRSKGDGPLINLKPIFGINSYKNIKVFHNRFQDFVDTLREIARSNLSRPLTL